MDSAAPNKSIGVAQLREQLAEVIRDCAQRGQRYSILRNNKPEAVLVGFVEWQMLNETLAILTDANLMEQIRASEGEIGKGQSRSAGEVLDEIERDLDEGGPPPEIDQCPGSSTK